MRFYRLKSVSCLKDRWMTGWETRSRMLLPWCEYHVYWPQNCLKCCSISILNLSGEREILWASVLELWFLFSGRKSYESDLIDIVCAVVLDMFGRIYSKFHNNSDTWVLAIFGTLIPSQKENTISQWIPIRFASSKLLNSSLNHGFHIPSWMRENVPEMTL